MYVAVKASLHASETSVFGLDKDELSALSKRFAISPEVINGYSLKSNPISVINSLSELGYKVVCSSGEAEIVWTLRRTFMRPLIDSPTNGATTTSDKGEPTTN